MCRWNLYPGFYRDGLIWDLYRTLKAWEMYRVHMGLYRGVQPTV